MKQALLNLLNESSELVCHLTALGRLSGFSLQLVAADSDHNTRIQSTMRSELCPATHASNSSQPVHSGFVPGLAKADAEEHGSRKVSCPCGLPCGLTHIAYPVVMDGKLLATLVVGVLRRPPNRSDFEKTVQQLQSCGLKLNTARFKRAYFGATVLSDKQYGDAMILVEHFAAWLVDKCRSSAMTRRPSESPQVEAVRAHVQSHLTEKLSTEKIAQLIHVSPSHLCRLFKRENGQTLTEYVNSLRIDEAKSLLTAPQAPIKSVAFATGFRSVPDFNRVFKRLVGMNPTQYRQSLARSPLRGRLTRQSSS